jgi:hypothetical protein
MFGSMGSNHFVGSKGKGIIACDSKGMGYGDVANIDIVCCFCCLWLLTKDQPNGAAAKFEAIEIVVQLQDCNDERWLKDV